MAIYKSKFTGEEIDGGISIARTLIYLQEGESIPEQYRDNLWQYNLYWQGLVYRCIREESPDLYYEAYDDIDKKHRKIYVDMNDWTWYDETNVDRNLIESESGDMEFDKIVVGDGGNTVRTTRFSIDDIVKNFNTEPKYVIECPKFNSRFRVVYSNIVTKVYTGQQIKLELKTVDNYTISIFGIVDYDTNYNSGNTIKIKILPTLLDLMLDDLSNIDTRYYLGMYIINATGSNIYVEDIYGAARRFNDYDGDYTTLTIYLY